MRIDSLIRDIFSLVLVLVLLISSGSPRWPTLKRRVTFRTGTLQGPGFFCLYHQHTGGHDMKNTLPSYLKTTPGF